MKSKYKIMPYIVQPVVLLLLMCMAAIKMNAQISIEMSTDLTTEVTDNITFEVAGDWTNNGNLLPASSTLILQGSYNQMLRQDDGSFHDIIINKINGDVILSGDVHLQNGTLTITQQDLILNGHKVVLDALSILSETNGNTVKGNEGYLTTTRNLMAPAGENIAGLGLMINSAGNYGDTEIRRGHGAQMANAAEGILRYFDFLPEFNPGFEASVVFIYDESELNGNIEADLKLFQSPDGGVNWIQVMGFLDTGSNSFEAVGINPVSRFTLSSHCIETCMATQALTHSTNVYLNAAGLAYLLPSEVNNNSRGACGIDSMWVFPDVFDCYDAGVQEIMFSVRDNNGCIKTSSATVNVMDNVPPDVYCRDITVAIDESCMILIEPDDIDNGSYDACGLNLEINISSFDCGDLGPNQVVLTATDPWGNSAQCTATVTIENSFPGIDCHDVSMNIGNLGAVVINPFDLISGDPDDYVGFTFLIEPSTLYCDDLGDQLVTLTATDPIGQVNVCEVSFLLTGPDADCDEVADQCDICDGGDDQQDADHDGTPDCADWDGWSHLNEAWQCSSNKVFVCHSGNVICVNQNAVQSHLDHGDFLGSCNASFCENFSNNLVGNEINQSTKLNESNEVLFIETGTKIIEERLNLIQAENIPNPFFPITVIHFYLPKRDWINVTVFDLFGKPVVRLAEGIYDEDWHQLEFNGSEFPDGIYFYRILSNQKSVTKAMILSR